MKINASDAILAPDFELTDTQGHCIQLAEFRGHSVVLVLLRGFI
jgi:peroxiredoxin